VALYSFIAGGESRELADEVRSLFDDLSAQLPHEQRAYSGECHPAVDVYETDAAIEVLVDVCGVPIEAIRIAFRDGTLIVAGEKAPGSAGPNETYHLVEREFGRFARAVRLTGALDIGKAHATLRDGELTITLPKRDERRGRGQRIAISAAESLA